LRIGSQHGRCTIPPLPSGWHRPLKVHSWHVGAGAGLGGVVEALDGVIVVAAATVGDEANGGGEAVTSFGGAGSDSSQEARAKRRATHGPRIRPTVPARWSKEDSHATSSSPAAGRWVSRGAPPRRLRGGRAPAPRRRDRLRRRAWARVAGDGGPLGARAGRRFGPVLEGVTAYDVASEVVTLEVTTSSGCLAASASETSAVWPQPESRIPSRLGPPQLAPDSVVFGACRCSGELAHSRLGSGVGAEAPGRGQRVAAGRAWPTRVLSGGQGANGR
jgi:hypothetical protein